MKKRYIVHFCLLIALFFIVPLKSAYAQEDRPDYLWGEVSYDDHSLENHIPCDYDTHQIKLDQKYKVDFELQAGTSLEFKEGLVNFEIKDNNNNVIGLYKDILISRYDECKNNIIDIELDAGEYQLKVEYVSTENNSIDYGIWIEYTKTNSKEVMIKDKATITFLADTYSLNINESESYDFESYCFYDEIFIDSSLEYQPFDITWKSSNKKIASVDKEGCITAHTPGMIKLTATLPNGNIASCKITVPEPTYNINKTKGTIFVGESITLKVIANPADQNKNVQWSTSNKSIASVAVDGKVTGKKAGKSTISAKLPNGKVFKCTITVKTKPEVIDVADYLDDPIALKKKQNDSFEFKYKNGVITYAKITGENATFYGLNPGEVNMASLLIPDYKLISSETVFMGQESVYKKKSTGEMIYISETLLTISTIEYYRE